jgi:geranylgeranyl diphosphate synthase, type I
MSLLPTAVQELAAVVEVALRAHLDDTLPALRDLHPDLAPVADELQDYVLQGGKRLRPVLLLLGHRATGGEVEDVLGPAVAVELLHTCALLHDDVIDAAPTRRGRPTTHTAFADRHRRSGWAGDPDAYGEAMAILIGDLAFVAADEAFLTAAVAPDRLLDGLRWFGRLRTEVMAGQTLDVHAAAVRSTAVDLALTVATLKSGRYSVTRPLQIGAVLGGADDALVAGLGAVGEPLGRAFQLQDDLLGVFGDQAETGKSATGDLAEGKRTLLIAEAWARLDDPGRAQLAVGLGDPRLTPERADRLRALIADCGARDVVEARIAAELAAARDALDGLDLPAEVEETLRGLTAWFADRRA